VNIALWIAQVLTALAFVQHGYSMLFRVEQARTRMPWTRAVSIPVLRFIGVAEILGAIGLLLPAATRVEPWLTVAAAVGLIIVMVLAILFHLTRREWPNIGVNIILGALAFAVAHGRLVIEPF
jgi:putative oxidoreductase